MAICTTEAEYQMTWYDPVEGSGPVLQWQHIMYNGKRSLMQDHVFTVFQISNSLLCMLYNLKPETLLVYKLPIKVFLLSLTSCCMPQCKQLKFKRFNIHPDKRNT